MTVRIGTRASKLALTQTQQTADQLAAVGGFPVELVHIRTDGDVLTGWALDGRGIVLKPVFEVADHLREGRLVPVATATPPLPIQLSALSQHRRLKDPKVQLFTDYMAAQIRDDLRRAAA